MGCGSPDFGNVFLDESVQDNMICPMTWQTGLKTKAVALSSFPALLLSCSIQNDYGHLDQDAKFVVMFLGITKLATGFRPVVQVLAKCRNMILLPKKLLLQLDVEEPVSSLPEIVGGEYHTLIPTRFMHLKEDYVWTTVQNVIAWDEDRQRGMARLVQAIPFVGDLSTASFSDQASQDVLMQMDEWFNAHFQVVGTDQRKVVRKLEGAKSLSSSEPAPTKEQRDGEPQHPMHVYFSCQAPCLCLNWLCNCVFACFFVFK